MGVNGGWCQFFCLFSILLVTIKDFLRRMAGRISAEGFFSSSRVLPECLFIIDMEVRFYVDKFK